MSTPMFASLATSSHASLRESRRLWVPATRLELQSLARESDAGLRTEGMLALARREEAAGRLEAAAELYAEVAQDADAVGAVPPLTGDKRERPLRIRAQEHLNAILGRGAIGPRAEFLLRNLAQQSSDPAMLFAMGTAGAVFRITRLATLSRLAATAKPGILTQLIGAGRLASLTGFALEAPAFTLAGRLGNGVLGRRQDWSGTALGRDFASSYLVLGGLKLAGWASGAAYRSYASPVGAVRACPPLRGERPLQTLFQQGGMLTGILLGHALEEHLGLRPHRDGATTLTDSLAMLLQLNVAGRLTRHAFGLRFAAWEQGLDARAAGLVSRPRFPSLPFLHEILTPQPLAAGATPPGPASGTNELRLPNIVLMAAHKPGGGHGGSTHRGLEQMIAEWRAEGGADAPRSGTRPVAGPALEVQVSDAAKTPSTERLRFFQEAVFSLLEHRESTFPLRWKGPLGAALRGSAELRLSLIDQLRQGPTRLLAQLHEGRLELSHLVVLENSTEGWRPRRILIGTQILRYDESQDPAVYDLDFSFGETPGLQGRVFRDSLGERWSPDDYLTRRYTAENGGGVWRWELYPKSSYFLKVELGREGELALEIADLSHYRLLRLGATIGRGKGRGRP
ncbi:MAG: hypothetical protein IT572_01035 [Deltaproteobacteria bacterium]|nr:hypothetical protein [Deltaproteobacteria bacterium]